MLRRAHVPAPGQRGVRRGQNRVHKWTERDRKTYKKGYSPIIVQIARCIPHRSRQKGVFCHPQYKVNFANFSYCIVDAFFNRKTVDGVPQRWCASGRKIKTVVELAKLIHQVLSVRVDHRTPFCPCAGGVVPLFVYCSFTNVRPAGYIAQNHLCY